MKWLSPLRLIGIQGLFYALTFSALQADEPKLTKTSTDPICCGTHPTVYLEALEQFRLSVKVRVLEEAAPQVLKAEYLSSYERRQIIQSLETFIESVEVKIPAFDKIYRDLFLREEWNSAYRSKYHDIEYGLSMSIDRGLEALFYLLEDIEKKRSFSKLKKHLKTMEKNSNFEFRSVSEEAALSGMWRDLKSILPVNRERFRSLWRLVVDFRIRPFFGLTKPVEDTIRAIPLYRFMRGTQTELYYPDFKPTQAPKGPAMFFVALNHESALNDGLLATKLIDDLKVDFALVLTTRNAWPQYRKEGTADSRLLFSGDPNVLFHTMVRIQKSGAKRVAVVGFPEGLVSFWQSQMPLTAKAGLFKMAQMASNRWGTEIPTYMILGKSNALRHTTSKNPPPLMLKLQSPVRVDPNAGNSWVFRIRLKFEDWITQNRGEYLVEYDQLRRQIAKDTIVPVASFMKSSWKRVKHSCLGFLLRIKEKLQKQKPFNDEGSGI